MGVEYRIKIFCAESALNDPATCIFLLSGNNPLVFGMQRICRNPIHGVQIFIFFQLVKEQF